jgi:hypothetical protein
MSAQALMSIHLFSPSIYLSVDLTIALSTDIIQNRYDYNAFQLPNLTAQCIHIYMSHHHEVVLDDSSCSMDGWGARAACSEVSTGSVGDSQAKHGQKVQKDPEGIHGRSTLK